MYDVPDMEMVTISVPPTRVRLYPVTLLPANGATQVKVMLVVPISVTLGDVGGSGVGGAAKYNVDTFDT